VYDGDVSYEDPAFEEVQQYVEPPPTPCARLIGCAGTGKTYTLLHRLKEDPKWAMLTSTTGISAVNLGCITLNSTLKYFDSESMRDAYLCGRLTHSLHEIAKEYRWLVVEEYSMLEDYALSILHRGTSDANRYKDIKEPLGILLVGDLAQLPPVSGRWCFRADCWDKFAENTERLTKVWRQESGSFLEALNLMRAGDGGAAMEVLTAAGVQWHTARNDDFEGTTILPVNRQVNAHNALVLDRLPGKRFTVTSRRWGKQRSEWGLNPRTQEWGIPPTTDFKLGAIVMIKSNHPDFDYVNGDGGHVVAHVLRTPDEPWREEHIVVKLFRTGEEVRIYKLVRGVESSVKPADWRDTHPRLSQGEDDGRWRQYPHYRKGMRRYVTGQIEFYPLSLAYASTVHKTQSLTLDKVQVDFRHSFFGAPAMMYVALSRCRTLEGLRLVGIKEQFVRQCKVDSQVLPWL
jgi:ATP-dependent DNA helicase PIF1